MQSERIDSETTSNQQHRIAVLTAVSGGKDTLRDPIAHADDVDFVAFSDRPLPHLKRWNVRPLPQWSIDDRYSPRRNAKLPKVLPQLLLPDYDYYVWIDGNIELLVSPRELCQKFLISTGADIAAFPHRLRRCVYSEAREVLRLSLDHRQLVRAQVRRYRSDGYGQNLGLIEMGFILRRNNAVSNRLALTWFEQICRYSSRDQLSFPVALARSEARFQPITPGHCLDNPYMKLRPHDRADAILPMASRIARGVRRALSRAKHWITSDRDIASAPCVRRTSSRV